MRIGLSSEITDMLKAVAAKAFALPPCQIPGCSKHALSPKFRCETCRRQVCLQHGYLRVSFHIPHEAPVVCVSCIIEENDNLLE